LGGGVGAITGEKGEKGRTVITPMKMENLSLLAKRGEEERTPPERGEGDKLLLLLWA